MLEELFWIGVVILFLYAMVSVMIQAAMEEGQLPLLIISSIIALGVMYLKEKS